MMASLTERRRHALTLSQPMAIPLAPPRGQPTGERIAALVQGIVTQTRAEAARRVLTWALVTFVVCALGGVYLMQTSHVASLASERAALERETARLQDANARLRAQVASAQAFGQMEQVARANGLREPPAAAVTYLSLPDMPNDAPRATDTPPAKTGRLQRVMDALIGRGSAAYRVPPATPPTASAGTAEARP